MDSLQVVSGKAWKDDGCWPGTRVSGNTSGGWKNLCKLLGSKLLRVCCEASDIDGVALWNLDLVSAALEDKTQGQTEFLSKSIIFRVVIWLAGQPAMSAINCRLEKTVNIESRVVKFKTWISRSGIYCYVKYKE